MANPPTTDYDYSKLAPPQGSTYFRTRIEHCDGSQGRPGEALVAGTLVSIRPATVKARTLANFWRLA